MAKNFLAAYLRVKEQVYSSSVNTLMLLASLNQSIKFSPVEAPNGVVGTTSDYIIQRKKRPSVNVVANPNAGSTASALAALDQFSKVDWESMPVATGVLRSVGFKRTFNDNFDFAESDKHDDDLKYIVGETAVARQKDLIALLELATAGTAIPKYTAGQAIIWKFISDEVETLAKIDDEYKDVQSKQDFLAVISSTLATELSLEMGVAFNQEAPIANSGLSTKTSINGIPVIVDLRLADRKMYIMHNEALAFKTDMLEKDVNIDLGISAFTGKFFYDVAKLVDEARIKKYTGTTTIAHQSHDEPEVIETETKETTEPVETVELNVEAFKGNVMDLSSDERTKLKKHLGLPNNTQNTVLQAKIDERK